MKNIYYFQKINSIGGIETFFRELSKKYRDLDITFIYQQADAAQLHEIRKYCRCIQFNPLTWGDKKLECDKAFFNFNLEFLDFVEAKEKILVVHGNYELMGIKPPQDSRLTKIVAVSKDSADAYTKLTGLPCEVCYNPLTYRQPQKLLKLICACRLEDPIKGGNRLRKFVAELDRYCLENNKNYTLSIFTSQGESFSPNVVIRKPRLDILPYMDDSDYLIQLSDAEGYCYSVVEMLYLCHKPVIVTPCPVYKELGITNEMAIYLDYGLENLTFDKMFENKWNFNFKPPLDRWDELLEKGQSTYEGIKMYKIRCLDQNFNDLQAKTLRQPNDEWVVEDERCEQLVKLGLVEKVEEVKDATREEEIKRTTKKAAGKTK